MKKKSSAEVWVTIGLAIFFLIFLSPIIIALFGSFREMGDTSNYLHLFHVPSLESYKVAFSKMSYFRSLKNSIIPSSITHIVIITVISVILLLTFCSMAGYAIARLRGKLGSFLQIFFLAGMIVSAQMSIIPMYKVVNQVGIGNTIAAPIALYVTAALPFSIFLYTNFIKSGVPYSLEEAARIDGASIPFTFVRIVIPLTKPALSSLIITQGVPIWNDFFFGMLFLSTPTKKTLPLMMLNFIGDMENATQWNMLFAACFLSAIPILIVYSCLQRYFVGGLIVGAVKG